MKKSNFLNGAIIATAGIIICKIIGLVYVIPFYAMIGTTGGALYSYAYSIYAIFLSLSTSGIPVAMSKLVSEYNALGQYNTKERIFKLGSTIIITFGLICFFLLLIFAPQIAVVLKGGAEGGNSLEDITIVIRVISSALLIVPLFSVTKGYLQGHKMQTASSISNIIEQLVRVIVLLTGTYLILKVFHLPIKTAVSVAVFAATVGAVFGYGYLVFNIKRNKKELNKNDTITDTEKSITTTDLLKRIFYYAIPFILIDLINSAYVIVDSSTVIKTLSSLGMSGKNAEIVLSSIATWATKLDMIVISVALGFVMSLIPHITANFVKNDIEAVNNKVNQAIEMLLLIVLPLTIGLSFLASPIWTIFYGHNLLSISVFKLYAFQALTYSLHWLLINVLQSLNKSKITLATLITAFIFKALLNIPAMKYLPLIGIKAYQAPTILTLAIQIVSIIFILCYLKFSFKLNFKPIAKNVSKIIVSSLLMIAGLLITTNFFDINTVTRFSSIMVVIIYATIGGTIYTLVTYKLGLLNRFIKLLKFKKTT
ncbi:MAG: polysaccharide biosynthesis protein [Bacilli bacterium]